MSQAKTKSKYWRGYPGRYKRELRRSRLSNLGCTAAIMAFFGYGTWFYGQWIRQQVTLLTITGLLVFGVPFFLFAFLVLWGSWRRLILGDKLPVGAHIVPYFETRLGLGPSDAPRSGFALARNCEILDEAAARRGVTRLADLGLDDDLKSKSPVWRTAEDGLRTVQALRRALKEDGECASLDGQEETAADLEKLESALLRAEAENVRYCLLLRISRDTRVLPTGVDLSRGSFW